MSADEPGGAARSDQAIRDDLMTAWAGGFVDGRVGARNRLVADAARLLVERDSARYRAVALENRIAKALDLASVYAGEIDDFAREIVAALSGGEAP